MISTTYTASDNTREEVSIFTNLSTELRPVSGTQQFSNHWGRQLATFPAPTTLFQQDVLTLKADALAIYLVMLHLYKTRPLRDDDLVANVRVGQERLIERSGFSKNTVSDAVKALELEGLIERAKNRKKRGEFGSNAYFLLRPTNRPGASNLLSKPANEPLIVQRKTGQDGKSSVIRNIFFANKVGYFLIPSCIVQEHTARWSLAHMTGAELRLYISLLYAVHRLRRLQFTMNATHLRELCGMMAKKTLFQTLEGLANLGLLRVAGEKELELHLCDPYTGEPLHVKTGDERDDPANYKAVADNKRERRMNFNNFDADSVEKLIRSTLPDDALVLTQSNGDIKIRCPFHREADPSCSVSPSKNGCFKCFGCGKKGSISDLIAQLKGITKAEAFQAIGTALGFKTVFRDPDEKAEAIYSYRDSKCNLKKQVLRYMNEDGEKYFLQRRPVKKGGGFIWDVEGVPPLLYHTDLLHELDRRYPDLVCLTEGEKDADTVTNVHFRSRSGGLVVGVTSGGAESWDPILAKELIGKTVVLMPDADEAGAKFAASVKASLDAENITYRAVTFEDVGCKDVTEFLEEHSVHELVERIGADLIPMPKDDQTDYEPLQGEITI